MTSRDDSENGKDADPGEGQVTFLHGAVPAPEPLPRGQHHLPPEYVAGHQRRRILDATTHVLAERGYGPATIGDIVALAHVSRRTFYDHFETKEQCVLASYGAATECIADAVRGAYAAEDEWDAAAAAALSELMRVLVDYPHTARACFLEIRSVGVPASERLIAVRAMCTKALRHLVADRPGSTPVDDMAFELGMGGLLAIITARVSARDHEALQRELPDITRALLEPLMGAEAAGTVVERIEVQQPGRAARAI